MGILALKTDERVEIVYFTRDALVVDLMDGRTISVPLTWYPKLLKADQKQRSNWKVCGGGYGIHWPDVDEPRPEGRGFWRADEDLSTEGLLRGAPAPNARKTSPNKKERKKPVQSVQRQKTNLNQIK